MEHRPYPPNATKPPQSRFPWPVIALVVALALLVVTLWLSPSMNKASTKEANMPARRPNCGFRPLAWLLRKRTTRRMWMFMVRSAIPVDSQSLAQSSPPYSKIKMAIPSSPSNSPWKGLIWTRKTKGLAPENFSQQPLQPGKSSGFRVSYTEIPQNWNHEPPQLSVLQVTIKK